MGVADFSRDQTRLTMKEESITEINASFNMKPNINSGDRDITREKRNATISDEFKF